MAVAALDDRILTPLILQGVRIRIRSGCVCRPFGGRMDGKVDGTRHRGLVNGYLLALSPIVTRCVCKACENSGRADSNRRRPAWEAGILPLNYARKRGFALQIAASLHYNSSGKLATGSAFRDRNRIVPRTISHGKAPYQAYAQAPILDASQHRLACHVSRPIKRH